jgi:uncharacterized protein (DUF2252 family)
MLKTRGFLCAAAVWLTLPAVAQADAITLLETRYKPHLPADDETAWQMKLASVGQSRYVFWRGTKDLFFDWSRENLAYWRDTNPESWVTCHGDIHLGNVGTYPISLDPPTLGFGLVDYDDADRLPPQYDLLQIAITLRLIADENGLTQQEATAALGAALDAYQAALSSEKVDLKALVAKDERVAGLLGKADGVPLDAEVAELTEDGRFRSVVRSKAGKVKELLSPMTDHAALARALMDAAGHSPQLAELFGRPSTAEEMEKSIVDAAWRTRIGSSGSQGLRKLLVLVSTPAGQRLIYLKQAIPSPAARAEIVALRPPPGRRVAAAVAAGSPGWLGSSYATLAGQHYWVSVRDPWSDELDHTEIKNRRDLMEAAQVLGLATAKLHASTARDRAELRSMVIEDPQADAANQPANQPRMRQDFQQQLSRLADEYIAYQNAAFGRLKDDDRYEDAAKAVKKLVTQTAPK